MDKKTLNNSKMGRLVARLFGKSELDVKDGKGQEPINLNEYDGSVQ